MARKKQTLKKLKEKLQELKWRPPRFGVRNGRIFKDKTKYTRKRKHKKVY